MCLFFMTRKSSVNPITGGLAFDHFNIRLVCDAHNYVEKGWVQG